MKQIVCSFSGGETSAYMAIRLKEEYPDTKFVFANTGQENEETLIFVDKVDKAFDLGVVWIESVPDPRHRKGSQYKVVSFESANRDGAIFEKVLSIYGLCGVGWLHCSRELKTVPITKWANDAFGIDGHRMAIGIRSDEMDRIKTMTHWYPMAFDWDITKPMVNRFWRDKPFRLDLKGYQGNCKWCWKKSDRKHFTLITENPEFYEFPERMESLYSETNLQEEEVRPRRLFRQYRTVSDLRLIANDGFSAALDDSIEYEVNIDMFKELDELDKSNGCEQSCEAF